MNEGKIREILLEILSDDSAEKVTKSILGKYEKNGEVDENVVKTCLPKVLSEDVKSDLASKLIYEISKEKPIMIKTFSEYLPDFLDDDAKSKIAGDIAEKVQKSSSLSIKDISEILPEMLSKETRRKISKSIYSAIRKIRARRIFVTDVDRIKPYDINEDNIYKIGKFDGLVARKMDKKGVWAFGYDENSDLGRMLRKKMQMGNPKMYTVVFKSAMSEDRFCLFSDVFGAAEKVFDDNYMAGMFKEFDYTQEIKIKFSSNGEVWVSKNSGEFYLAGEIDSTGVFVSMYEIPIIK